MNHTPRFCTFCGSQLTSAARFCGACGHRVQEQQFAPPNPKQFPAQSIPYQAPAPPPTPPPPPQSFTQQPAPTSAIHANQPGGEAVLSVLPILQRRKGLFGSESFAVVLTSHRLIFALVTSQMLQDAAKEAKEQARQQGKGFFNQWGAMMSSGLRFSQRYLGMAPNSIMAEHRENFYLLHNQVQQVRLKSSDPDEPNDRDQVEIHSNSGKQRFTITYGSLKDIREALKPLYGNRVR